MSRDLDVMLHGFMLQLTYTIWFSDLNSFMLRVRMFYCLTRKTVV